MDEPLLTSCLWSRCDPALLSPTRLQALPDFGQAAQQVWTKREDESGFGISGCKKRKYASLLPWVLRQAAPEVVLIGGSHSNHVVGFSQLLREHQVPFRLYLRRAHRPLSHGNGLLRELLMPSEAVRWISAAEWPTAEALARRERPQALVIPEGGTLSPALPGACTLWSDLRRNEAALGLAFDHLFIDSGTALVAGALLGMKQWFRPRTHLHVVLTAGDEAYFDAQYHRFQAWAQAELGEAFPAPEGYRCYRPATAKAFGQVNRSLLDFTQAMARQYGLFTDPVYTSKLFQTAQQVLRQGTLTGKVLIIHSGGGTGLMGLGRERFASQ